MVAVEDLTTPATTPNDSTAPNTQTYVRSGLGKETTLLEELGDVLDNLPSKVESVNLTPRFHR